LPADTRLPSRAESKNEITKPFFKNQSVDLLRTLGIEHEQRYLRELSEKHGLSISQIATSGSWKDAVAETLQALRQGVDAVYQGTLLDGPWGGRSDFLVRVNTRSAFGSWSYEVVETKLARSTKATALVQLCFYSDLLARIQGMKPQWMHVVLGGRQPSFVQRAMPNASPDRACQCILSLSGDGLPGLRTYGESRLASTDVTIRIPQLLILESVCSRLRPPRVGGHKTWRNRMLDQANQQPQDVDPQGPTWGEDAPRGGKAVLNRIIKEKATVPLFFGQTLVSSLRDMGYNSTTSALCEHVDNAIQWGATEVRVYFHQSGKKGDYKIDALVLDNGKGMSPNVLKVATAFGGSLVYGNRSGIGRYGMGMKTAALSLSPVMDLYSWQEPGAIYNMTLDVEAVGRERTNLIELPDPTLMDELPSDLVEILTKPVSFPDPHEQTTLTQYPDDLKERLGRSGTIVYMPACDRLTSAKARTLCEQAVREMSRVYRRFLAKGTKLYVNNRLVKPFDPTYSMANARHANFPDIKVKQSRLVCSKVVTINRSERTRARTEDDAHATLTQRRETPENPSLEVARPKTD
jgi:hypothetical protein